MAFYHFLAIFPALLLFLITASRPPHVGLEAKDAILDFFRQVLPADSSSLFRDMLNELSQRAVSGTPILPAFLGCVWAACNGTWALMYGLNTAYEVQERRRWWKLSLTIVGLTIALAIMGASAVFLMMFGANLLSRFSRQQLTWLPGLDAFRVFEWAIIVTVLMFSLALIYRFAPNLRDHKWRWSTPGALFAVCVWAASTIVMRFYFEHLSDYRQTYGHLNQVVMLLLWLYVSNGAILIGGEMNSEIEKAGAQEGEGAGATSEKGGAARSGS
jgi:membrane protein